MPISIEDLTKNVHGYESLSALRGVLALVVERDSEYRDLSNSIIASMRESVRLYRSGEINDADVADLVDQVIGGFEQVHRFGRICAEVDAGMLKAVDNQLARARN